MTFYRLLFTLGIGLLLHGTLPAQGGSFVSPVMQKDSRVEITVRRWLKSCPSHGFAPVKVKITNGSSRDGTWDITTSNSTYRSGIGPSLSTSISVPAGRIAETVIYAPLGGDRDSYQYDGVSLDIGGPGVAVGRVVVVPSPGHSSSHTGFIAMGELPYGKGWSGLEALLEDKKSGSSGMEIRGSEVDMKDAPEDWRGYSGIAQLWMDETEWQSMRAGSRAALLDWVAMGGEVHVLVRDDSDAHLTELKLPALLYGKRSHGAGEFRTMKWDGQKFPEAQIAAVVKKTEDSGLPFRLNAYDKDWPMKTAVGTIRLKADLIFGFIVVFGILVGPVNLFVLAGSGRRHRLFWTTPLISVIGTVILICLMILQDGTGGQGARMVLGLILPEEKRLIVLQEQISKTGVLMGNAFPKHEQSWMQPLVINRSSRYNRSSNYQSSYSETSQSRSGDWFANRAIQAQFLTTVRPSRAAIEWYPVAEGRTAPEIVSSIEVTLEKVFLVDEENKVWMAENVGTGQRKVMQAASHDVRQKWLEASVLKKAGPVLVKSLPVGRGTFWASSADASKFAIATLESVRWKQDDIIFAGPYVRRS